MARLSHNLIPKVAGLGEESLLENCIPLENLWLKKFENSPLRDVNPIYYLWLWVAVDVCYRLQSECGFSDKLVSRLLRIQDFYLR